MICPTSFINQIRTDELDSRTPLESFDKFIIERLLRPPRRQILPTVNPLRTSSFSTHGARQPARQSPREELEGPSGHCMFPVFSYINKRNANDDILYRKRKTTYAGLSYDV